MELIEQEVERRVSERIGSLLDHISKTYDVNIKQLTRDATLTIKSEVCMGFTAKNARCGNKVCKKNNNGYCAKHQSQKPRMVRNVPTVEKSAHTHGPNIMFVDGCPGCRKKDVSLMLNI